VLDASGVAAGSMAATQLTGKLSLVDLAGSERVKRSGADEDVSGRRMKEAININTSLLGLSNVMKALSSNASYIPCRSTLGRAPRAECARLVAPSAATALGARGLSGSIACGGLGSSPSGRS
jgi:hypothetical protein